MTIYYTVDLEHGIRTEERPTGYYSKSEDLNVTVFKSLRAAKRKFNEITKDEIKRIHDMRLKVRAMSTREEILQHETADDAAE